MNEQALFCDGSGWYVSPQEPDFNQEVILRFRTAKEDTVRIRLLTDSGSYELKKESTEGEFDYYFIEWRVGKKPFRYCFEIMDKERVCYYDRRGVVGETREECCFCIAPGFSTPEWAKGAVMYQIFTDRFYDGDASNNVKTNEYFYIGGYSTQVEHWGQYPAAMDVREFYGGDLKGVMKKLDYLQGLGVEVLYFNPLFVSPSSHKYDTQDYDYIDPHFGVIAEDGGELLAPGDHDNMHATKYQKRVTEKANLEASNALFIRLVEELHRRGMKIILDGVFNHCGSFNKWMDRERIYEGRPGYAPGAYVDYRSPHRSFFRFQKDDGKDSPYFGNYDGWWGHDTLPKLNYEGSRTLEDYILRVAEKWVSPPYNIDGWRLDVAADLGHSPEYNHRFWKKFRRIVKKANPDALILAEHYGDACPWLQGDEWDSVMNYDAFMEPVTWFLTGMEKHSDEYREDLLGNADAFVSAMQERMARMMTPSLQAAMNELSNHDHSRFLTRTNHKAGRAAALGPEAAEKDVDTAVMREAVVMQMTWVGAPTVYYGDEAGLCGFTDPDNRRAYPWGKEDQRLLAFHKEMIRIHKNSRALKDGSVLMLYWERDILAYGRFTEDEQVIVIVNNGSIPKEVSVPVWRTGTPMRGEMRRLMYTHQSGYTKETETYAVQGGEVVVEMGAKSALVMEG